MRNIRRTGGGRWRRQPLLTVLMLALGLPTWQPCSATATHSGGGPYSGGVLEAEVRSDFSHIRIRKQGDVRMMLFVRDRGEEVVESILNVRKPHDLLAPYSRFMFASYLIQPEHKRVLLVGLGGGAMVHFLKHYDPTVRVDAVEIDPAVVELADRYFDVRSGGNVNVITADAFAYLRDTKTRYDVIYMDAFLRPSSATDSTGVPTRLKTLQFYRSMQERLQPNGLVAFNLNRHRASNEDIQTIRAAFGQAYVFRASETNLVVVGSMGQERATAAVLRSNAAAADRRLKASFSFRRMLSNLVRF